MSREIREHSFNTGVVIINYAEGPPSGPPLVLLHAGSARWQNFNDIMPGLASHWHLYAPDFRGHGKSGRVPGRYRFQDYTDDTISFLRRCVTKPACLFGHSLGGIVALMVAAQSPDCVKAIVVGDAPLTREVLLAHQSCSRQRVVVWRSLAGGQLSIEKVAEVLKNTPAELSNGAESTSMCKIIGKDESIFTRLATNLYHNDPDMLNALLDDFDATIAGYEEEEILPAIRCPLLLLQADPDCGGLMTDAEVERATLLDQSSHVRLKGASHFLFDAGIESVMRTVQGFLESL